MESNINSAKILLVEDNPADQKLTLEALRERAWAGEAFIVEDGVEVLRFLRKEGNYGNAPAPDLILLDLNLPKLDGREVLRQLKGDRVFRRIPVVVLSTSDSEEDVGKCYDRHANCFITKPIGIDAYFEAMQAIEAFWLGLVKLPTPKVCA